MQNGELFSEAGGGELKYIPALNARDDHVSFLSSLIERHVSGWPESGEPTAPDDAEEARRRSRERALALGAER
jgi:ferrochelatase